MAKIPSLKEQKYHLVGGGGVLEIGFLDVLLSSYLRFMNVDIMLLFEYSSKRFR